MYESEDRYLFYLDAARRAYVLVDMGHPDVGDDLQHPPEEAITVIPPSAVGSILRGLKQYNAVDLDGQSSLAIEVLREQMKLLHKLVDISGIDRQANREDLEYTRKELIRMTQATRGGNPV